MSTDASSPRVEAACLFVKYMAKGVQERIANDYAMYECFDESCGAILNHHDEAGVEKNADRLRHR